MRNTKSVEKLRVPKPPRPQTLLDAFRRRKGVGVEALGVILGKSTAMAARYCLPADDPGHSQPPPAVGRALKEWSRGLIHLGNFSDPWTPEIDAEWTKAGVFTPEPEAAP